MVPRCALVVLPVLAPLAQGAYECPDNWNTKAADALCYEDTYESCSDGRCCEKTCAAHECNDGWTANASAANVVCAGGAYCQDDECCTRITKCDDLKCQYDYQQKKENPPDCGTQCSSYQCCEAKAGTCSALQSSGATCADGRKVNFVTETLGVSATTETYSDKCCIPKTCGDFYGQSCPEGKFVDTGIEVSATSEDYQDKCCSTIETCDSFTCSAGYEKKSSADLPSDCSSSSGWGKCSNSLCCKKMDLCGWAEDECSSDKFTQQLTAYDSSMDFASTCCASKLKCSDAVEGGEANGTPRVATGAMAMGVSAFGAALAASTATAAAL